MEVVEIKEIYYLVAMKVVWNNLYTKWLKINNLISANFSSSLLASILGLFLALLIPIVILLLENSNSYWDNAVILNRVIRLKRLIIAVFGCSALVLWNIFYLKPILLLVYALGFVGICQTLINSVKWLADWAETSDGIRVRWRKEILNDSGLNFQELIRVWNDVFRSFEGESEPNNWFFPFKEYEEAYKNFDLDTKLKFLSMLTDNLNLKILLFQHDNLNYS